MLLLVESSSSHPLDALQIATLILRLSPRARTLLPPPPQVAYGFLSDCVPIGGLKRKPYMLIGWIIHIVCNSALAIMGTPGVNSVVILSFLSACGYLLSDVMTDAIVVEK